ncbi:Septin-2 [Trichoplax sp. H2]|nr:Septin-2 [Trichoplax sp. H2]|eukprot:RDD38937.1 Septin-2 [Trichoplax sp. H2]
MSSEVKRVLGPDRPLKPSGTVGFSSLPDQLVNRCTENGFDFNVLCIGETGCGKSTLMDSLFKTEFEDIKSKRHSSTSKVGLDCSTYVLKESQISLRLTLVHTESFGDQINKGESCEQISKYVDDQFERYLQAEMASGIRNLHGLHDTRIHACLYFVSPTGHSIKALDLKCMEALHRKVNIIPLIAKADTISIDELQGFKSRIMGEINANNIEIYHFPADDKVVSAVNKANNERLPFAIIGSREKVKVGNEHVRARQYPWGVVQVENENHCDFTRLRDMLIRTNMDDLREKTHHYCYEMYRRRRLQEMGYIDVSNLSDMKASYEKERAAMIETFRRKEEEIRDHYMQLVKEKDEELKRKEQDLLKGFEKTKKERSEEKKILDKQRKTLDEEITAFSRKRQEWEAQHADRLK